MSAPIPPFRPSSHYRNPESNEWAETLAWVLVFALLALAFVNVH